MSRLTRKPTIVQKYGGSSLADAAALRRVAQRIVAKATAGDGCRLVVVVSAMGSTTDALLRQAHEMSVAPPQRELDMLVTTGERISMALLCMAVAAAGGCAMSLTGSQSGIVTENVHQGARIIAIRPQRIVDILDKNAIAIVAGYQGVGLNHEITTLGRGGSDTTAVALGAALGAQAVEILSDVDGVYSADPRVCPQARHLPEVGYTFMSDMAHFGAEVLHHQAVAFAQRAGITVVASASGNVGARATRLGDAVAMPKGVLAVTCTPQALWLQAPDAKTLGQCLPTLMALPLQLVMLGGASALGICAAPSGASQGPDAWALATDPIKRLQVDAVTLVGDASVAHFHGRIMQALTQAHITVHTVWCAPKSMTVAVPVGLGGRAVAVVHALLPA